MLHNEFQYEEKPIYILDLDVRKKTTKDMKSLKVQWNRRVVEEATRETEKYMQDKYL